MVAADLGMPSLAAWDRTGSSVWVLDRESKRQMLSEVAFPLGRTVRTRYELPRPVGASIAVYESTRLPGFEKNLLLASIEGRCLVRLRITGERAAALGKLLPRP